MTDRKCDTMKKTTMLLAAVLTAATLLAGCSAKSGRSEPTSEDDIDYGNIKTIESPAGFTGNVGDVTIESGDTYAVITVQNFGAITVKLFPEAAPEGVQIFTDLANSGYYNNTEIHRVVADYMFQGGSQSGDGTLVEGDLTFDVEYNTNMRSYYGALCFDSANTVNNTQFFIVNKKSYTPMSATLEQEVNELLENIDEEISLCLMESLYGASTQTADRL